MAEAAVVPVMPLPGTPPPAPAAPVVARPETKVDPLKSEVKLPDPQLAAAIAKEKAFVAERQKFAAEREAFGKERAELEALRSWKTGLVRDPEGLKDALGENWYEKLTEYRLNGNKVTPELVAQTLDAKLSEWDKRQEDRAQAERQRIADEQKATVDQFRTDTTDWVKAQPEFELINLHGAQNLVTQVIENHFATTQKILSAKEAADVVEKHLEEQVKKSLELSKFKKPALPEKRSESAQPRTLTSALTAVSTPPAELDMSDDARLARAIAKGEAVRKARMGGS